MAVPQLERLVAEKIEWQKQRREMDGRVRRFRQALNEIGLTVHEIGGEYTTDEAVGRVEIIVAKALEDTP